MTPTARTLKYLRELGYCAEVVERWIPQARKRQDLFGFADLAAVHPAHPATLYVQCTSGSNHASRRTKLHALSTVELVKSAGNRVQIISWRRSARSRKWEARIEEV